MKKQTWLRLLLISLLVLCTGCNVNTPAPKPTPTQNVEAIHKEDSTLKQETTVPVVEEQQPNQPVSLADHYAREVDAAYEADALLPEHQSTAGMCELNGKYANRWVEIADEYYEKLMNQEESEWTSPHCTVDEFKAALKKMKAAHDTYQDDMEEAYSTITVYVYDAGTIGGPVRSYYHYEMEKEWALKVLNICAMLGIE